MKLGVHVSLDSKVINRAPTKLLGDAVQKDLDALGLNSAQIFTYGPHNLKPNNIDYDLLCEKTKDIDLSVHSPYKTVKLWNILSKSPSSASQYKTLLANITAQLESCKKAGAWGWVLHITKQQPETVAAAVKKLKPIAKKIGVKILLEMVSSKADSEKTYETPEKIDNLTTLIGPHDDWWGWVVDTAHLHGAGVSVSKYVDMKRWLELVTYKKKILMFHLNGSSAIKGSGKDKHEIPFTADDIIWHGIEPRESGLRAVVEFAVTHDATIICEINRGTEKNVRHALEIIKNL